MKRLLAATAMLALGAACVDPPPHVILEVTDPDNLASNADTLALGRDLNQLQTVSLGGQSFPVELTIDGFEAGEVILFWVDALDGDEVLARGRVRLEFPDGQSGTSTVVLAAPCTGSTTVGCALPDSPGDTGVCIEGRCGESFCGDGVVDASAGEGCDDGNENTQDACPDGPSGSCQPATCGDGYLHNGVEPCDDGNLNDDDVCRSEVDSDGVRVCIVNVCGDGFVNTDTNPQTGSPFEECDDGNDVDEDACRIVTVGETVQCVANVCGDGIVNRVLVDGTPAEECDDGNDNPNDYCDACARPDWNVQVRFGVGDNVGKPTLSDGDPSTLALDFVSGLTTTLDGDLVIADAVANRIWRYDVASQRVTSLAGIGLSAALDNIAVPADRDYGDGQPALLAGLTPFGVAVDRENNLYVADRINAENVIGLNILNNRIRRIDLDTGIIETVAGGPRRGFDGDSGPATAASLDFPTSVAVSPNGDLFIADSDNNRVRRVRNGVIETVAGDGSCTPIAGTSVAALSAGLCRVLGLAIDSAGNVLLSTEEVLVGTDADGDGRNDSTPTGSETAAGDQVWSLNGGTLTLVAGNGLRFGSTDLGDGGDATAANLFTPWGLAFDDDGALYIADADHHRVRRVDTGSGSAITTVAGTGTRGREGDGSATGSDLDRPIQIAFLNDALYVGELEERILRVDVLENTLTPFTGAPPNSALDGRNSRAFPLDRPRGTHITEEEDLYIADQVAGRIYRVRDTDGLFPPNGPIETVAGSGGFSVFVQGFGDNGDGGPARDARLNQPHDVSVDAAGNVYIADTANHRIRRVDADTGIISTFAGTGEGESAFGNVTGIGRLDLIADDSALPTTQNGNFSGDGGAATAARFNLPTDVEVAPNGDVYVADFLNRRIRRISALDSTIDTIAGDGGDGFDSVTGPGIGRVADMSVTPSGVLYFVAYTSTPAPRSSVWRYDDVDGLQEVTTLTDLLLDDSPARVEGIAVSEATGAPRIYVGVGDDDRSPGDVDELVYRVIPGSNDGAVPSIEVVAGIRPNAGQEIVDGFPAIDARLRTVGKMSVDRFGNWLYADEQIARLRGVDVTSGIIDTVVGWVGPGDGSSTNARLGAPVGLFPSDESAQWLVLDRLGQTQSSPNTGTIRVVDLQADTVTTVFGRLFGSDARFDLQLASTHRGLSGISGFAANPVSGDWYVVESDRHSIYRIERPTDNPASWIIERFAGLGDRSSGELPGSSDGTVENAGFRRPGALVLDVDNQLLYLADTGNHTIRLFDLSLPTVSVGTVAGLAGNAGYAGDGVVGGLGDARFRSPTHVALACDGSLYVSDTGNHRVRRIDFSTNTVTTVMGNGAADTTGQGQPGAELPLSSPAGLAFDRFGNLLIASSDSIRVVSAGDDGACGNGVGVPTGEDTAFSLYGAPPRQSYPESVTRCLSDVGADPNRDDRVFAVDACQGLFLELTR